MKKLKNSFSKKIFFRKFLKIFRKTKILKNRKIAILKNQNFEKSKIFRDFQNFRKNIFSKKNSIEKKFDRFFFDELFSEHHVRQPTLIRDASRAPRSDVAALRRKENSQNPHFGAENPRFCQKFRFLGANSQQLRDLL